MKQLNNSLNKTTTIRNLIKRTRTSSHFILVLVMSVTISLLISGCVKDMMEEITSSTWNNERGIIHIKLDQQLGDAQITRDSIGDGLVSFYINPDKTTELSLRITELNLSYGAISDKKTGDYLSFNNEDSTAVITITAASGLKREWIIKLKPFEDEIVGVWDITHLHIYGGMWPQYGGTKIYNMSEIVELQRLGTPPLAEYDNIITFTLEGITEEGDSYGTVTNDSGADGLYADFWWQTTDTIADVNKFYRKIPKGTSNWKKTASQRSITFTPIGGGTISTCKIIDAGTMVLDVSNKSVTIAEKALQFDLNQPNYQPTLYLRRNVVVDSPKIFFVELRKRTN